MGNEKGSALLLALFTMMFVLFLANEVTELTLMEYLASSTEVKRVQARATSQACLRLSLLRIKAYQRMNQRQMGPLGPMLSFAKPFMDMIWSFPLTWPLTLPKGMNSVSQSVIQNTMDQSFLKQPFSSSIESLGGKIDINDLGSPSETVKLQTRQQILQIFQTLLNGESNDNKKLKEKYESFNFEQLLNNIQDWVDPGLEGLNGGNEATLYSDLDNENMPPNSPFKTMEELHLVSGMTDELYEFLTPHLTLYGPKGVDINSAPRMVLLSLFPSLTLEEAQTVVDALLERRQLGPMEGNFNNEKEFFEFLSTYMNPEDFQKQAPLNLFFSSTINFEISCFGSSGPITQGIRAVVYDAQSVQTRLVNQLKKEKKNCSGLRGDSLYQCLCRDALGANKKNCIQKARSGQLDQRPSNPQNPGLPYNEQNLQEPGLPPGPPPVIFIETIAS